jgi:hypothetical protein
MKAVRTSVTSFYDKETTLRYIPEGNHPYIRGENLKSHMKKAAGSWWWRQYAPLKRRLRRDYTALYLKYKYSEYQGYICDGTPLRKLFLRRTRAGSAFRNPFQKKNNPCENYRSQIYCVDIYSTDGICTCRYICLHRKAETHAIGSEDNGQYRRSIFRRGNKVGGMWWPTLERNEHLQCC